MTKDKRNVKEMAGYRIYTQYILAGAGLGLYFGLFNRNTMQPDYSMAIYLALVAGVVTTAVRSWKKHRSPAAIALDFVKTTLMFLVFILALQLKSTIEAIGGKTLVVVFMTFLGLIYGLVLGVRRKQTQAPGGKA